MTYNLFGGTLNLTQSISRLGFVTSFWIGFCLTGPISLCVDSLMFVNCLLDSMRLA